MQWKQIRPGTMRLWVWSLALLSGLRIWCCHGLWTTDAAHIWCGYGIGWWLQLRFNPYPGNSICCGCGHKKRKKEQKSKESLCELLNIIRWNNVYIVGVSGGGEREKERERNRSAESLFKKIMAGKCARFGEIGVYRYMKLTGSQTDSTQRRLYWDILQ